MKRAMKNLPIILLVSVATVGAISCRKQDGKGKASALLSLRTDQKGSVPGGSDPQALCSFLKEKGYFPKNSYPANTKVLFSTSYEVVEDSAGQGYGVVGADGFFEQQGNTTTQLLVCPGAISISGGKCNWKINGDDGYAQLAFDVVCNKRSRQGTKIHPGYSQQSASLVSYQASTAGQSTSGQDAVEVVLQGRESKARIVFAKGVGLVATVFQESLTPAGTAEVFIGGTSSGSMFGD
jgi:hypothetical protein